MSTVSIQDIQAGLHNVIHHRAYCILGPNRETLFRFGRTFAATLRSLGIAQSDYYQAVQKAAETTVEMAWCSWEYQAAGNAMFPDRPVAGFCWVDVRYGNGEVKTNIQASQVEWMEEADEAAVVAYRINANPENFWVEANKNIGWDWDYYDEPVWAVEPKDHERVCVRYGTALNDKASTNQHVYWLNGGWINRFGQTMSNVSAWRPLSEAEEAVEVEPLLISKN